MKKALIAMAIGVVLLLTSGALWLANRDDSAAVGAPLKLSANQVVEKLGVDNVQEQNAANDPNKLLGRPNQYTQRFSFDVPGYKAEDGFDEFSVDRGGVLEVWTNTTAAQKRSTYIQDMMKANPVFGTEYDFVKGPYLLRISGKATPDVANNLGAKFTGLEL